MPTQQVSQYPEFLMMRRPEFLMMRRPAPPRAAPRRPAPPQKSGSIGTYYTTHILLEQNRK
jgi:hypothetical protein